MADKTELLQAIDDAILDADSLEKFINGSEDETVLTRLSAEYPTLQKAIKELFINGGLPAALFQSLDELQASELVNGDYAVVTNDGDENGVYIKEGGAWVKTSYGDISDAVAEVLEPMQKDIAKALYVTSRLSTAYDDDIIPLLTDKNGGVLIGYDMVNEKPILSGLAIDEDNEFQQRDTDYNHLLHYGQSLSVGAVATNIISTSQPYSNLTFDTGPRMDSEPTGFIPLVEQHNSPASDGKSNRGETPCSASANYASVLMAEQNGVSPDSHKIISTTAGHGGYKVSELEKGTEWYEFLIKHVQKAKQFSGSNTYSVKAMTWIQGENDASAKTSYAVYRQKLEDLQRDATKDISLITKQGGSIPMITYQLSTTTAEHSDIALAQLDLVRSNKNFHLSTPMYHMDYVTDGLHLTAVGYKVLGAYIGRAYKQVVIDGREKSDFINPLSAVLDGDIITITCKTPTPPLVVDTTTLASVTDKGFKVVDGSGSQVSITNVEAAGDSVVLTLSEPRSDKLTVRYGLDYRADSGTKANATAGMGNIRDSTEDSVIISGNEYHLYHVLPHFSIDTFTNKGV